MRSTGLRVTSDRGAAPAEWALVAGLLTLVFLTVLQVGFALHIRTTLIDAAAEGARIAGLRGASAQDGVERTERLIETALSPEYAAQVEAHLQGEVAEVRVTAPLPLIGMLGFPDGLEVHAYAPVE